MTDEHIKQLCMITTRTESGEHFTTAFTLWDELEDLGLIRVYRRVHRRGQSYDCVYDQELWRMELTPEGEDVVIANPELHPVDGQTIPE